MIDENSVESNSTVKDTFIEKTASDISATTSTTTSTVEWIFNFFSAVSFTTLGAAMHIVLNQHIAADQNSALGEMKNNKIFRFFTSISLIPGIYFIFQTLLLLVMTVLQKWKVKHNFSIGLIKANKVYIGLILSFFINEHFSTKIFSELIEEISANNLKSSPNDLKTKDYFSPFINTLLSLKYVFGVFLAKGFTIFTLNYNIHHKYYFQRIQENSKAIDLCQKLCFLAEISSDDKISVICSKLIKKLARKDDLIHFSDLSKLMDPESAKEIFIKSDPTGDMKISHEELEGFFRGTLSDQQQLNLGMLQNNASIDSLDSFFRFVCLGISVLIIVAVSSDNTESFKSLGAFYGGALLSGSYCFSDTFKKFSDSIAFIFIVRPFEVNDTVLILGEKYKVKQINLLSTLFLKDNLVVHWANNDLYSKQITNLRSSSSQIENYRFTFNSDEFKEKSGIFRKTIVSFTKKHLGIFKALPYFDDIKIKGKDNIEVTLVTEFNLEFQELDVIEQRKNSFVMSLKDIMKEVGLNPI